jgi:uncharacterized protein YjiS (DUF1127 family)
MFDTMLARYRAWEVKQTTIRQLGDLDDRLLADLGIPRQNIETIAERDARNAVARRLAACASAQCVALPGRTNHAS